MAFSDSGDDCKLPEAPPVQELKFGLQSPTNARLLNKIDQIRSFGIGDCIDLPQLVVSGDQSAGKSSVLEGLTGVPFPRQDGLCTTFPTEIIMRHDLKVSRIHSSVIPGPNASEPESRRLKKFQRDLKSFDELPELIAIARELFEVDTQDAPSRFSENVLRLEVTGNVGLHLTIVDLPGLIAASESDVDSQLVDRLVNKYMQSSRTIMLVVLQAANDVDTQTIITRAHQFDEQGERTIGVVTKPDLINKGTESRVAALTRGAHRMLKLGYFLLRNPNPDELKSGMTWSERVEMEEEFFQTEPWFQHELNYSRVGITALRTFCQDLLARHIEREMPKVRKDIERLLSKTGKRLLSMGPERSDTLQMRTYLAQVNMDLKQLSRCALEGLYDGEHGSFFNEEQPRLRARLHWMNGAFSDYMRNKGHKNTTDRRESTQGAGKAEGSPELLCSDDDAEKPLSLRSLTETLFSEFDKGQSFLSPSNFNTWIKTAYRRTRGRELPGNFNAGVLTELFQQQSSRWQGLASAHIDHVSALGFSFLPAALAHVVQDDGVRERIGAAAKERFRRAVDEAKKELSRLVEDEKRPPITYNHYYTDNVQKLRQKDTGADVDQVVKKIQKERNGQNQNNHSVDVNVLATALQKKFQTVDMDEQACHEMHIGLDAYYKVARKTFVDNVCRQVVERHIVSGLEQAFDPTGAIGMPDEQVEAIAGETESVRNQRSELKSRLEKLTKSLDSLAEQAWR